MLENGDLVEIYWNRTRLVWSVRKKGKVVAHVYYAVLKNVDWVVQPGGYTRYLKTRDRNVHAFARGLWVDNANKEYSKLNKMESFPVLYDLAIGSFMTMPESGAYESVTISNLASFSVYRSFGGKNRALVRGYI